MSEEPLSMPFTEGYEVIQPRLHLFSVGIDRILDLVVQHFEPVNRFELVIHS